MGKHAREFWGYLYWPQPGDVVVDVGAGRGEDTIAFSAAVGPDGRAIAIEPNPVSFKRLCDATKTLDNVYRVECAASSRYCSLQIETLPNWKSNYTFDGPPTKSSRSVAGFTLNNILQHLNKIDLLKMNIEGAEVEALRGAKDALAKTKHIVVAAHDFRGSEFATFDFVAEALIDAGFQLVTRRDDPRDYVRDHIHGRRVK